jgi:hypothetical protein
MTIVSFSTIAQPNPRARVLIEVPETAVARLGAGKRVPVSRDPQRRGVSLRDRGLWRYYLTARKEVCAAASLVPVAQVRAKTRVASAKQGTPERGGALRRRAEFRPSRRAS